MKKILYCFLVSFALSAMFLSCKKDDSTEQSSTTYITPADFKKGITNAEIGGSTFPNQVYIDLSTGKQTKVPRTSWDLGFYSGSEFRVILNGSIKMAAKKLELSDIKQVVNKDPNVMVGTEFSGKSEDREINRQRLGYIDDPSGDITKTVIEVSDAEVDNKVYLLNMGLEIANKGAEKGAPNLDGVSRGWKKIRILRESDGYKLQYADLGATEDKDIHEISVSKNKDFNFSFVSLITGRDVNVEPKKDEWHLSIAPFSNVINSGAKSTYFFSDFVVTNRNGGVATYMVMESEGGTYEAFNSSKVDQSKFQDMEAKDQRAIGDKWRNVRGAGGPKVFDDRFFVLKDVKGNTFKVKFIALTNKEGERGNISFMYELLK